MKIILASQSPRRRELLSRLDYHFSVDSCDIDESIRANERPEDYLVRMVNNKASVFIDSKLQPSVEESTQEPVLVITADTIGVMPNGIDILIKPVDKADAFKMWHAMSGHNHFVWTAVKATLINNEGQQMWQKTIVEKTDVRFITLTLDDMEGYWATEEPADKAGGYAIQGLAAAWVESIQGSYTNVVGLPLAQVKQLIAEAHVNVSSREER